MENSEQEGFSDETTTAEKNLMTKQKLLATDEINWMVPQKMMASAFSISSKGAAENYLIQDTHLRAEPLIRNV